MGKKNRAKRASIVKERRKHAEAAQSRAAVAPGEAASWLGAHDAEPNVIMELVAEGGALLAYVESDDDGWTILVDDNPVAGTSEGIEALCMLLSLAADNIAAGSKPTLQISQWFAQEIEERCEATDAKVDDFLRTLVPAEKRLLPLPQLRIL
ncbi:hypothetical protein [Xanthomonas campestris]|uniref:hypothetical protein n=1 Tax=Xanthomonas campestris TaxID=339 RepID=UPI001CD6962B|nr:hypothetical protein [Xanthomonas campestris]